MDVPGVEDVDDDCISGECAVVVEDSCFAADMEDEVEGVCGWECVAVFERRFTTIILTASCCAKWPSTSTIPAGRSPALSASACHAPWSM